MTIFGDKNKTLDFTHAIDFVDGVMLLLNKWDKTKNQKYDISGNDVWKLSDIATKLLDSKIVYSKPEIAQPQKVKLDISKYGLGN